MGQGKGTDPIGEKAIERESYSFGTLDSGPFPALSPFSSDVYLIDGEIRST